MASENPSANSNNYALYAVLYSFTESPTEGGKFNAWFYKTRERYAFDDDGLTRLLSQTLYDGLAGRGWPWLVDVKETF